MTNRERIIKTLKCERIDRAPFTYWLGFEPWNITLERWRKESEIRDLNVEKFFEFEPFSKVVPAECGPVPCFESSLLEETDGYRIVTDKMGIRMRQLLDGSSVPDYLDFPIHSREDWQRYKDERLNARLSERLGNIDELIRNIESIDAPIQVGEYPYGVFGTARFLLGTMKLLMGFYDEEETLLDIMRTFCNLWLTIYREIASKIRIDHVHLWEDMAGKQGSLISMRMVNDFMMPQYDMINDFCNQYDVSIFSVDSDGLVDELVPTMMSHGVNAFMPFEVQAGNRIEDFRRMYPRIGILGGLDKRALAEGKQKINAELSRAEYMMAQGGYIPGFDHAIPPNVSWDNYRYFVNCLRRIIGV